MHSEIKCYNENYNFNEIFEYDIPVMLIPTVFGLNEQQKYIRRYCDTIENIKANQITKCREKIVI